LPLRGYLYLLLCGFTFLTRQHHTEKFLNSHSVAAYAPTAEEVATARPTTVVVRDSVRIVFPSEVGGELLEAYSFRLLSVAVGLLDLPDQTRMHRLIPPDVALYPVFKPR
jgi:hypothetical protein